MIEKTTMQPAPKPRSFSIESLRLDLDNPRFVEPAVSQTDAINKMVKDGKSKLYKLASDIMTRGQFNPTELPIVVGEGRRRVVVEGNRRLTCLKLLSDPTLAEDRSVQRRFKQIRDASAFEVPTSLLCVPFETLAEANPWIVLRHTGANDGVGVAGWDSQQNNRYAARHNPRGKTTNQDRFQAMLEESYPDDQDLLQSLARVRRLQNTTLGRLLLGPEVLSMLGLAVVDGRMLLAAEPDEARPLFAKVLEDLGTPRSSKAGQVPWSRALHGKADRIAYLNGYSGLLPNYDSTRLEAAEPKVVSDEVEIDSLPADRGPDFTAKPRVESPRDEAPGYVPPAPVVPPRFEMPEDLLFEHANFEGFNGRLRTLSQNARKIRLSVVPDVAGILARVLVDLCVQEYLERHGLSSESKLDKDIKRVLRHLDPEVTRVRDANDRSPEAQLHAVYLNVNGDSGLAVRTLQKYVHSTLADASVNEVRFLSKTFTPMLTRMSEQLSRTGHEAKRQA